MLVSCYWPGFSLETVFWCHSVKTTWHDYLNVLWLNVRKYSAGCGRCIVPKLTMGLKDLKIFSQIKVNILSDFTMYVHCRISPVIAGGSLAISTDISIHRATRLQKNAISLFSINRIGCLSQQILEVLYGMHSEWLRDPVPRWKNSTMPCTFWSWKTMSLFLESSLILWIPTVQSLTNFFHFFLITFPT